MQHCAPAQRFAARDCTGMLCFGRCFGQPPHEDDTTLSDLKQVRRTNVGVNGNSLHMCMHAMEPPHSYNSADISWGRCPASPSLSHAIVPVLQSQRAFQCGVLLTALLLPQAHEGSVPRRPSGQGRPNAERTSAQHTQCSSTLTPATPAVLPAPAPDVAIQAQAAPCTPRAKGLVYLEPHTSCNPANDSAMGPLGPGPEG